MIHTIANRGSANRDSKWLPWLKLLRISALPSAASNILAGFLLANHAWTPISHLLYLLVASSCLYLSGMVLNDICDVEVDQKTNPNRPIPSDQISKSNAFALYAVLTIFGLVIWCSSPAIRPVRMRCASMR
ncbi:MAG: UbiA family prenyltransferase, partial [Planctomycetota bacterium]